MATFVTQLVTGSPSKADIMAEGSLAIQPMSVEGERLLSAPGKTASGLRTHLNAGIIAICQVLHSWRCAGLIKDLDPLPNSHLESKTNVPWDSKQREPNACQVKLVLKGGL